MSVSKPPRWESGREKLSERSEKRKKKKREEKREAKRSIYHSENDPQNEWVEVSSSGSSEANLPAVSEEKGMGDILYNLVPDSDADPVKEVQDVRDRL